MNVGDKVRIERDELIYPSKGTWPQFRGKTGTIVEFNLGEIGVALGKALPASGKRGGSMKGGSVTWFQPYEVRVISRTADPVVGLKAPACLSVTDDPLEAARRSHLAPQLAACASKGAAVGGGLKGRFDRAPDTGPKVLAHAGGNS